MSWWILGTIASIMGLLVFVGYYFTNKSLKPVCWESEKSYQEEVLAGMIDKEQFEQLLQEDVIIQSDYTCQLKGTYFPNGVSEDTVVIVHGYSYTKYGSVKYMRMFYELGFNILIYDHRGHGVSGPSLCTMGYLEKYDLAKWLDWIEERNGKEGKIGTLGVSMGGATVLMHSAIDERIDFVIADCPYASVWEQFAYILKKDYRLPTFPVLYAASLVARFRIGTFFSKIAPEKCLDAIEVPVLWIHGQNDTYIPPQASQKMYQKKEGMKKLLLIEGAEHAECYQTDPQTYEETVRQFLVEIGMS